MFTHFVKNASLFTTGCVTVFGNEPKFPRTQNTEVI